MSRTTTKRKPRVFWIAHRPGSLIPYTLEQTLADARDSALNWAGEVIRAVEVQPRKKKGGTGK